MAASRQLAEPAARIQKLLWPAALRASRSWSFWLEERLAAGFWHTPGDEFTVR
jgi:hypothetical protein